MLTIFLLIFDLITDSYTPYKYMMITIDNNKPELRDPLIDKESKAKRHNTREIQDCLLHKQEEILSAFRFRKQEEILRAPIISCGRYN